MWNNYFCLDRFSRFLVSINRGIMALQHIKKLPGNFLDKLFNDIYHKLAKMTLCSSLNVDKYQGNSRVLPATITAKHFENISMST